MASSLGTRRESMRKTFYIVSFVMMVAFSCASGPVAKDDHFQKVTKYVLDNSKIINTGLASPLAMTITPDETIFVSNVANNTVTMFIKKAEGMYEYNAEGTLSKGLKTPTGLTFDPHAGVLYVASYATNTVAAFKKGKSGYSYDNTLTVKEGMNGPYDASVMFDGTMLVCNFNDHTILGYKKNNQGKYILDKKIDIP